MKRQMKIDDLADGRGSPFGRMLTLAVAVAAVCSVALAEKDGFGRHPDGSDPDKTGVIVDFSAGRPTDLAWFREAGVVALRHAERTMADGTKVYVPQGGCKYEAFWLRDYEMMLEADLVPVARIRPCAEVFLKAVSPRGEGVDCVRFDGRAVYKPGYGTMGEKSVLDGCAYTVLMAHRSWRRTRDKWFLASERLALLEKVLAAIPHDGKGLSWIDPERAWERCPWGFTDTVRKAGACLFSSLLEIAARRGFAEMLEAAGAAGADGQRARAAALSDAVNETFWDETRGLYRAATVRCREHDVAGSAYAAWLGVADAGRTRRIARVFKAEYAGLVRDGQVRHLLPGTWWEKTDTPRDEYQNGAWRGTFTGWFAWTLAREDRALALRTFADLRLSCERHGAHEWISGARRECPEYLSTLALPHAGLRRLLAE